MTYSLPTGRQTTSHDKEKPRPATVRGGMNINDWLQKAKNNEI